MVHDPTSGPRLDVNIFEAVRLRQGQGSFGHHSTYTKGDVYGSLLWGLGRDGEPRQGHMGCVNTVHWNTRGTHLVSGGDDCELCVWNVDGHLLRRMRTAHAANIFDAQFRPNNEDYICSCAADGSLCMMAANPDNRSRLRIISPAQRAMALKISFSPSNPELMLSSFGDGHVRIFDLRTRGDGHRSPAIVLPIEPPHALVVAQYSPCGNLVAAGIDDFLSVRVLDIRSCTESGSGTHRASRTLGILPPQRGTRGCSGVSWSSSGRQLLANYMAGDVVIFDAAKLCKSHSLQAGSASDTHGHGEHVSQVFSVGANEGHEHSVALDRVDSALDVFGIHEQHEESEDENPSDTDSSASDDGVASAPDGEVVSAEDLLVQRFSGRRNIRTFAKQAQFMFCERFVASGGDCGHLFIWRVSDGALVLKLKADSSTCNAVAPHPTLPIVAASGIDDTVTLFGVDACERRPLTRKLPRVVSRSAPRHTTVALQSGTANIEPPPIVQPSSREMLNLGEPSIEQPNLGARVDSSSLQTASVPPADVLQFNARDLMELQILNDGEGVQITGAMVQRWMPCFRPRVLLLTSNMRLLLLDSAGLRLVREFSIDAYVPVASGPEAPADFTLQRRCGWNWYCCDTQHGAGIWVSKLNMAREAMASRHGDSVNCH